MFALAVVIAVVLLLLACSAVVRTAARIAGRFVAGWEMDGIPRTNATWLAPATEVLVHGGRAWQLSRRWTHLPGWQRSAMRLTAVAALTAAVWGWFTHRQAIIIAAGIVAGIVMLAFAWALWRAVQRWQHRRRYVRPLAVALAPRVGVLDHAVRPEAWLTVPIGFHRRDDMEIRLQLPPRWIDSGAARRELEHIVKAKLALCDVDADYYMVGNPTAVFRQAPRPPSKAIFADSRLAIEAAPPSAPVIGYGHRQAIVAVDLDAESPHVLVSASSGAGKSVLLRLLLAQGLHNGGIGLILDVKRVSHAWARGLPNVCYCRSIEEIHDALLWAKAEVDRRYDLVDAGADEHGNADHVDVGPRLFILAEEMNATINRLQSYWREVKGKSDPQTSPAVQALGDILFMGRQGRVHVLAVAQMMTARTLGGPEARENFATRILARYSVNAWRMLVPEVWPMPKSSRHTGRVQVVLAGTARETQVIFMTTGESREWAVSGTVARFPDDLPATTPQPGHDAVSGSNGAVAPHPGRPALYLAAVPAEAPVGLAEAISAGILTVKLPAVRSARARDPEFPAARGKRGAELLYAPSELRAWERNRERAGKVAQNA